MTPWVLYLAAINIVAFIVYGLDKRAAQLGLWRIPEIALIALAVGGGPYGALAGMTFFRHKTLRMFFRILNGVLAACYLAIIFFAVR